MKVVTNQLMINRTLKFVWLFFFAIIKAIFDEEISCHEKNEFRIVSRWIRPIIFRQNQRNLMRN